MPFNATHKHMKNTEVRQKAEMQLTVHRCSRKMCQKKIELKQGRDKLTYANCAEFSAATSSSGPYTQSRHSL